MAQPMKGLSPGTGVADLDFSLVFRLYISAVQSKLINAGLGTSLHIARKPIFPMLTSGSSHHCIDPTWVDDNVVMIIVPIAADVHPIATLSCSVLFTELRRIGIEPNTKRGKCQVMPIVNGEESLASNQELFNANAGACRGTDGWGSHLSVHYGLRRNTLAPTRMRAGLEQQRFRIVAVGPVEPLGSFSLPCAKTTIPPAKQWRFALNLCVSRLSLDAHTDARQSAALSAKMRASYNGLARRCCAIKFSRTPISCLLVLLLLSVVRSLLTVT